MQLYTVLILVFHRKKHHEVGHKWYHHNQVEVFKKLCKLWLMISVAKCGSFFITDKLLLTFEIALWIRCLKLSFLRVLFQDAFDKMILQLEHYLSFWVDDFVFVFFFLKNKTSCPGLLGSGLKSNFQLKVYLEINCRSLLRIFVLSFLFLIIAKRDVSSANSFALDFNWWGESFM